MPTTALKRFLDDNRVKYVATLHSRAYTAQEIAALAHVSGKEWAKTVVVMLDGKLALAVIPAAHRVIFDLLKAAAGATVAELASEQEFAQAFPDCELGAMPPFGNLYGLPVYVSEALARDEEIAFNACSFNESVRMPYAEFARLAKPVVAKLSG